jgi:molecular chaperone DnaK
VAVGFDFGTTNSLISVILRDKAVDIVGDDGLPFPSVVRYQGERTVVGRKAKEALDTAGVGVHGDIVLSPKFLLGDESTYVGGVERSPVDIVHEVVRHVKSQSLKGRQGKMLDGVKHAVVTIPVTMTGPRRRALRDAFGRADIGIVQFVHEPFAALYGHIRGHRDPAAAARALNRRNILVVDWGGGTLDLTLCRVERKRIVQLRNGGTDEVGGDQFDQSIRDAVIARFSKSADIPPGAAIHPDARLRLLHDAETNKIALSERASTSFYRPDFFVDPAATLEYRLTRDELDEITRPLIMSGMRHVESLLDSVGLGPEQVATCLVVGGMASMPAVRGRLNELFGPQRVEIPSNSATLVAQGAAWIAHDKKRLQLAKPVELQLARGSFLPLIKAGADMPAEREEKRQTTHLFCTDPTDGLAKFELCAPKYPTTNPQISDPRSPLGIMTIQVDSRAKPFKERLELDTIINDDLILTATARSLMAKDIDSAVIHDLEFGLPLPSSEDADEEPEDNEDPEDGDSVVSKAEAGLSVRANLADGVRQDLVPGEVLHVHNREMFEPHGILGRATQDQKEEYTYYQPCAVCKRDSNDPACRCAS